MDAMGILAEKLAKEVKPLAIDWYTVRILINLKL
jgi:hypothetical protein